MSDYNTSQQDTVQIGYLSKSANMNRLLRLSLQLLATLAVCLLAGCRMFTIS